MEKRFLTTPIYYANGKPHIGHAGTTVIADVSKKSLILQGYDCKLSTGLDEHGQKNQKCIEEQKVTQEEYFGKIADDFKSLFARLDIDYDFFVETTSEHHKACVSYILQKLFDEGKFEKRTSTGLYCVGCEQFKQPSELDENGNCPDHKTKPIEYSEQNWFFNLENDREWLKGVLNDENFLTDTFRKEMLNLCSEKLPDLCISRPKDRVWLGITLPFDPEFVTYVWFDALINYISVLGYPNVDENFKEYWANSTHFLAKDIVKTHSIYWPIMLKAIDLNPPKRELVHGYFTFGGNKMGKSLGNGINPEVCLKAFGSDATRYLLTKLIGKSDAEISYDVLLNFFNNDLSNTIGNAFYRVYSLCRKTFDGCAVPQHNFDAVQTMFLQELKERLSAILPKAENIDDTSKYIANVLAEFRNINAFIDTLAPWAIADVSKKSQALLCVLEALKMAFEVLYPVIPQSSQKVLKCLGVNFDPTKKLELDFNSIKQGFVLEETTPLFVRMKPEDFEAKIK